MARRSGYRHPVHPQDIPSRTGLGTLSAQCYHLLHIFTHVQGGSINIDSAFYDSVITAVANFSANNTDPKASLIATFNSPSVAISLPLVTLLLFYDDSAPPPGTFDAFLAVPFLTKDISTRSFLSLVQSAPANATSGSR
jgi:hypothetical protein